MLNKVFLHTKDSTLRKDSAMRRFGVKRKSAGATKRLRCTEWRPNSVGRGGTAVLWCAVLVWGTWRLVSCSLWSWGCLSMSVFIPLLCSISKAQSKNASNSLLKLSSYSDLDYQVWSDVLHTTVFQQSLTLQLCVILFSC